MGFTCAKCGKHKEESKTGIEVFEGRHYVICNHCDAENEIVRGGAGAGPTFQVLGILKRDKNK